ncbi:alpha/beta hydrolase family protein [Erythrobacter sp.]|jgi:pimeloyl-ACP methyl ester carboxylesterase|uniref:alpha/beta hydrolase family protein n=1 Tax=Erythrobacter sp. TaxID=1042 RepID=UPI002EC99904|nr:alpha/beta hydrolase [Erythrobacter sp.]
MRIWTILLPMALMVPDGTLRAQTAEDFDPTGYWTGAIVKEGSVLPVEIDIEATEEGLRADTRFSDWYFYSPSNFEIVRKTANGLIIEDFLAGDAVLALEPRFEQLIGSVGSDGRTLHLKRAPRPPEPLITMTETSFVSADGTRIAGSLTMPQFGEQVAGIVIVRGRGCATRVNGKARFLARYGIAVLTYDKRGSGSSQGDCETFTFEQLTDDAMAAHGHLAANSRVDRRRVGFMGESAGAWTIQAATERLSENESAADPAFLVTWIGPLTSIIQQQISSAATYGASIGLSAERQAILAEVSRIIVDPALTDDEAFAKLDAIRISAQREGWLDRGFGADDIPRTRTDMSKLWLRRFAYDPAPFFDQMGELPYLAVFGGKDPIVPVEENVAVLRGAGSNVEIVVLEESGHGYNFDERKGTLTDGRDILLFEGPDTGFIRATLEFLEERGFLLR